DPRRPPQQAEPLERERQPRRNLGRVRPIADELGDRLARVEPLDEPVEQARLLVLVDDDAVAAAPPELERDAGEGDPPREDERAAVGVEARRLARRAADLEPREPLQLEAAAKQAELVVAQPHPRGR